MPEHVCPDPEQMTGMQIWEHDFWFHRGGTPDRECTVCGTIASETTMEFEQGAVWNRGTFRCYDTDACDRRASGLYVTGDYDDMERDDGV